MQDGKNSLQPQVVVAIATDYDGRRSSHCWTFADGFYDIDYALGTDDKSIILDAVRTTLPLGAYRLQLYGEIYFGQARPLDI